MSRAEDIGLQEKWDRDLSFRRGSPARLLNTELYYDFNWYDVFENGRAQFRNGLCLAKLVHADCPDSKTPALLLTTQDPAVDVIETDSHYVAVINLPDYLRQASADAAKSYYATRIGRGLTGVHELIQRPDVVRAFVEHQLTLDDVSTWLGDNQERIEQVRGLVGEVEPGRRVAGIADVFRAVETLGELDAEVVAAITALLGQDMDSSSRLRLLRALTDNPGGRVDASEVLGQRLNDRLADARAVTEAYTDLLADLGSEETDLQDFIEGNPWLLGLEYVAVRPRRAVPRGELDFILERYDGFHDLLELKSPQDAIIEAPDAVDGVPPSASRFRLSEDLSKALAQIHFYRDVLAADESALSALYGLRRTRNPRVIVVIGQMRILPEHRERVLRELNHSLHRVEIVPYDLLADRARAVLTNVEQHLHVAAAQLADRADVPQPEAAEAL